MYNNLKILFHQGKQYIPDPENVEVPGIFRGRPIIQANQANQESIAQLCPTGAIGFSPLQIDLGKCTFCGECAIQFPQNICFTKDYKIYSATREALIINAGADKPLVLDPEKIREEIHHIFRGSLKLRQVSAGGDNSCEWELNASGNVNFDIGRYGIEFVASPRHADGLVITGPISENMCEPLQICYDACPNPKVVILAGTDAISGGIFSGSSALNRSFLDKIHVDLYLAGNPVHPLTFVNGVLNLIRTKGKL